MAMGRSCSCTNGGAVAGLGEVSPAECCPPNPFGAIRTRAIPAELWEAAMKWGDAVCVAWKIWDGET